MEMLPQVTYIGLYGPCKKRSVPGKLTQVKRPALQLGVGKHEERIGDAKDEVVARTFYAG